MWVFVIEGLNGFDERILTLVQPSISSLFNGDISIESSLPLQRFILVSLQGITRIITE
jgi:hypothetical protein